MPLALQVPTLHCSCKVIGEVCQGHAALQIYTVLGLKKAPWMLDTNLGKTVTANKETSKFVHTMDSLLYCLPIVVDCEGPAEASADSSFLPENQKDQLHGKEKYCPGSFLWNR